MEDIQSDNEERSEEEDNIICACCCEDTDAESLLLCDGCKGPNSNWHIYCLSPPLDAVPIGKWYCPSCTETTEESCREVNGELEVLARFRKRGRKPICTTESSVVDTNEPGRTSTFLEAESRQSNDDDSNSECSEGQRQSSSVSKKRKAIDKKKEQTKPAMKKLTKQQKNQIISQQHKSHNNLISRIQESSNGEHVINRTPMSDLFKQII
jgi:hypothetical protein